jgi:hypothetical protein
MGRFSFFWSGVAMHLKDISKLEMGLPRQESNNRFHLHIMSGLALCREESVAAPGLTPATFDSCKNHKGFIAPRLIGHEVIYRLGASSIHWKVSPSNLQKHQNGMIWQNGKLAGDLLAAPLQASQVSKKE